MHCSSGPGACFSKVPKLFGTISGATIAFISSQRRGSKPSNFAILLVFLILKTCKKISVSKQGDCNLTTSFSGPKSSRDVRETGPWSSCLANYFKMTFFVTFRSVNFKSKLPSPNFSACCLIPMNSIKCLQAISIELCFSISNGTRPLCRSNADPSSSR